MILPNNIQNGDVPDASLLMANFNALADAILAVAVSASQSAAAVAITTGTWTALTLDTEEFDLAGNFASGIFTAPVAGRYLVTFKVNWQASMPACYLSSGIFNITTSTWETMNSAFQPVAANPDQYSTTLAVVCQLAANDQIRPYVYHSGGTTKDIVGGGKHMTRFTVVKIN